MLTANFIKDNNLNIFNKSYNIMSVIYDDIMIDIDYKKWTDFIVNILKKNNISNDNILEFACGTGNISSYLAKKNYNVIGVDNSYEMIKKAYNKKIPLSSFLVGNMVNIVFKNKFNAACCIYDSINHLCSLTELEYFFKNVNYNLNKDGIFIFDIITENKIDDLFINRCMFREYENVSFIWEIFEIDDHLFRIDAVYFIKNKNKYIRLTENYLKRIFTIEQIKNNLEKSGFYDYTFYNNFNINVNINNSQRIVCVCKKGGK